jgi:hypothetical protein
MSNWYKKASPISSDWLQDLHHPGIKENIGNQQVVVYHGTSSKRLFQILAHGSLDPSITEKEEFKSYQSSSYGIFVSTSATSFMSAGMYAFHAAEHEETGDGSDKVVLELVVPWKWIEEDPDDTEYIDGERSDLGKTQGVIRRPISVKRIRNIVVYNDVLKDLIPSESDDILEGERTRWVPIGNLMDVVKKNKDILSEEYQQMSFFSKGLSRTDPYTDREEEVALKLLTLIQTFLDPTDYSFDDSLSWVLSNKDLIYDQRGMLEKYLRDFGAWETLTEEQGVPMDTLYEYYQR